MNIWVVFLGFLKLLLTLFVWLYSFQVFVLMLFWCSAWFYVLLWQGGEGFGDVAQNVLSASSWKSSFLELSPYQSRPLLSASSFTTSYGTSHQTYLGTKVSS